MGYAKWSNTDYDHLRRNYQGKSRQEIFQSRMSPAMDPHGLSFRESRDSEAHPNSIAIAVFLDFTGAMGMIPEQLIRHKLGSLMDTLLDHGVEDPQVMFSAIGDHITDRAPLQLGQFESGALEMNDCLAQIYIEGGGGGQSMESYLLAWLIAGRHTSIDCYEKRKQKGFLFTVGDEKSWNGLDEKTLKFVMGYPEAEKLHAKALLEEAQKMYHVFHIHVNETGYKNHQGVFDYWKTMLGERFLILNDHRLVAELVAATVAMIQGIDLGKVTGSFDGQTAGAIRDSLKDFYKPDQAPPKFFK
jgi:hypothetical protein